MEYLSLNSEDTCFVICWLTQIRLSKELNVAISVIDHPCDIWSFATTQFYVSPIFTNTVWTTTRHTGHRTDQKCVTGRVYAKFYSTTTCVHKYLDIFHSVSMVDLGSHVWLMRILYQDIKHNPSSIHLSKHLHTFLSLINCKIDLSSQFQGIVLNQRILSLHRGSYQEGSTFSVRKGTEYFNYPITHLSSFIWSLTFKAKEGSDMMLRQVKSPIRRCTDDDCYCAELTVDWLNWWLYYQLNLANRQQHTKFISRFQYSGFFVDQ